MLTMHHSISNCLAVAVATFLCAACSGYDPSYPSAYREALTTIPGAEPVPAMHVDEFVELFSDVNADDALSRAESLYAPELYFSDTLLTAHERSQVVRHLETLRRSGTEIALEVHDRIHRGADVYVIWSMTARFQTVGRNVESETIGVTHLRFDENGRVVLQQDFWDAAHGFYQHVPVLGSFIRQVGSRFGD